MHLLIPAAGMGKRMGADRNKLLLTLLDQPILAWTLLAAEAAETIEWIGIISQPSDWPMIKDILATASFSKPIKLIQGGDTRQESVFNGLNGLPSNATQVLIHDGARCLATSELFDRCTAALQNCDGLIAAVPVKDTIKVVGDNQIIESTPDRDQLWAAQTPQGFTVEKLKQCHQQGREHNLVVTDDAALFEHFNQPVTIVMGEETNLKVTTPMDLAIAEFILHRRLD